MYDLPFRFLSPWYLLLLAVPLLMWWLSRRSLAGLPKFRRYTSLILRLFITVCLVLALARIQWRSGSGEVAVYYLLDWSDSIPNAPYDYRKNVLNYISKADKTRKSRSDKAGVIYFGSDATCELFPSEAEVTRDRQAVIDTEGTDIAAAIRLAMSTFPPGVRKRIVVASDGNQNRGNALEEAVLALQQGAEVDVFPVEYSHDRELAVEKMILPSSIQEGVPFKAMAIVHSTKSMLATVTLKRGNQIVTSASDYRIDPGRNVITVQTVTRADPGKPSLTGIVNYTIDIEPQKAEDDQISGNNEATAFTRIHGPPTILYIDGNYALDADYKPILPAMLRRKLNLMTANKDGKPGEMRLYHVTENEIPNIDDLAGFDCIILDNVPADSIGADRMERIRALVNDQGVGLVMVGGDRAFGCGNYRHTPVETALPVDMDLKNQKIKPNGALAIILHTCEFPNGNWWAKKITQKSMETLGPYDYFGVIQWLSQADWHIKMQLIGGNRTLLKQRILQATPCDAFDYTMAINKAVAGLKNVNAAKKHIIVISDGDPSLPTRAVMKQLPANKITLSGIVIAPHGGQDNLQIMAKQGGGRYYLVNNPKKLPRIFIKESMVVRKSLIYEEPFVPVVNEKAASVFTEKLGPGMPQLHGYVTTTIKPQADLALFAPRKDPITGGIDHNPILAHWRYGLGQTVAFTSDAKNRWAKDWVGWESYGDFWAEIIYRILRQKPSNLKMNTVVEGGRGRVVVQAIDKDGNPLSFLNLTARITTPDNKSVTARLRQTGVDTYEADFPANAVGKYHVAVSTPATENYRGIKASAFGGVAVPRSAEMENLKADTTFLSRLAEKGGGKVLSGDPGKDDVFNRNLPVSDDFKDYWTALLFMALVLFPLDVFMRRVMIDWGEGYRYLRERYGAWRGRPIESEDRMDRLMQVKQDALRERKRPEFIEQSKSSNFSFEQSESKTPFIREAKTKARPKPAEPIEETYTSRLLKAKKRATDDNKRK